MKKTWVVTVLFTFLSFTFLFSCHDGGPKTQKQIERLIDQYAYASKPSFTRHRKQPAFVVRRNESHIARLIQIRPGRIQFYVPLLESPVFYYSFSGGRNAVIEITKDFPEPLTKKYIAKEGRLNKIRLEQFENAIVGITLRVNPTKRFFGEIDWGSPRIESFSVSKPVENSRLKEFRKKHRKNNVLLILLDALNPFHLGCYRYDLATSPVIDSMAAQGVLWEQAVAQASYTYASTGSLLTGLYPDALFALSIRGVLHPGFKTMAESFREAGFRTAFFTSNPNASPPIGHGQGFETIWNFNEDRDALGKDAVLAEEFVGPVKRWLDQVRFQQFFAYLHIREPHTPYHPPLQYRARFLDDPDVSLPQGDHIYRASLEERSLLTAAYDANLAYADAQLGKIIEHLKFRGLNDNTILIVISDHGEALWEHGHFGHYWPLYEEVIRIPLIIRFPQEQSLRGMRRKELAGSIDLFPTFADLFGFSQKEMAFHGKSLLSDLFSSHSPKDRPLLTRTDKTTFSVRTLNFKYIHDFASGSSHDELYLIHNDPSETQNVLANYPITASYLRMFLKKNRDEMKNFRIRRKVPEEEAAVLDEESKKQLKALGYVE